MLLQIRAVLQPRIVLEGMGEILRLGWLVGSWILLSSELGEFEKSVRRALPQIRSLLCWWQPGNLGALWQWSPWSFHWTSSCFWLWEALHPKRARCRPNFLQSLSRMSGVALHLGKISEIPISGIHSSGLQSYQNLERKAKIWRKEKEKEKEKAGKRIRSNFRE